MRTREKRTQIKTRAHWADMRCIKIERSVKTLYSHTKMDKHCAKMRMRRINILRIGLTCNTRIIPKCSGIL